MDLQKLIDGLKAHKYGAAAYESVDEAIRVFEAMRDVDGEKVCKGLELTKSNPVEGWDYRGEGFDGAMVHTSTALIDAALALIRQQQERIAELEANRDAVASKTSDLVGYLANLATTTKYFHGDHVDIPLDVYAECVFRLNKYYERCEELEAAQTAKWEEPVAEGVWSWAKPAYAQCSNCKKKSYLGWKDPYCRYCGAKMLPEPTKEEEHESLERNRP